MLQLIDTASPAHLSMCIWSMGRMGKRHEVLCQAVAANLAARLTSCNVKNMCNAMYGFAQLKYVPDGLAEGLADQMVLRLKDDEGRLVERVQMV